MALNPLNSSNLKQLALKRLRNTAAVIYLLHAADLEMRFSWHCCSRSSLKKVCSACFEMQELREKIDRQYNKGKPISFDKVALHDAAALLKLFLRELPQPLLTAERVNAFIQVDSQSTFHRHHLQNSVTCFAVCCYLTSAGPRRCSIGLIHFLAEWHQRHLNLASVCLDLVVLLYL